MEKLTWIIMGIFLILGIAGATQVIVSNEVEALSVFSETNTISKGECNVLRIEKEVSSVEEVSSKPYVVTYQLWYTTNGEKLRDVNSFETNDIDDKSLEVQVALACNTQWSNSTNQKAINNKRNVKIVPSDNKILGKYYDVVEDKWKNKPKVFDDKSEIIE